MGRVSPCFLPAREAIRRFYCAFLLFYEMP